MVRPSVHATPRFASKTLALVLFLALCWPADSVLGAPTTPPSVPHRFGPGHERITNVTTLRRFAHPMFFHGMSHDGSLVSFDWCRFGFEHCGRVAVGVLDTASGDLQVLARPRRAFDPVISPDGEQVAFLNGHRLKVADISSGDVRQVAAHAAAYVGISWLDDGRIVYLDVERRVMFVRPGHAPAPAGLRLPDPPGYDELRSEFSVSQDGSLALYARGCQVWLRHLSTRAERSLGSGIAVSTSAWSPTGRRFVLLRTHWYSGCKYQAFASQEILFARAGRPISYIGSRNDSLNTGVGITWSTNGQWVLIAVQPTGTAVTGYQYLRVASLGARTQHVVLPNRLVWDAFVGPGDRVVFARYDDAETATSGNEHGSVLTGTLVAG